MDPLDVMDPNLLVTIDQTWLSKRIAGEENVRKLVFLIGLSAKCKTPLSGVIKAASGTGKSEIVNRALDPFRRLGMVMEYTRITSAYLDNLGKNTGGTLNVTGKILLVEEARGVQNTQAPKLMISEGKLKLGTMDKGKPIEVETIGRPAILTTTTLPGLEDSEFENRLFPIQADESETQTKKVLEMEAAEYLNPVNADNQDLDLPIADLIKRLSAVEVAIPFADQVSAHYPSENLAARRDYRKLMNLTAVITYLYQYQRQGFTKNGDRVITSEIRDLELALDIAGGPLQESLQGISQKDQPILDYLRENTNATVAEITLKLRSKIRRGKSWIRDHLNNLDQEGYVEIDREHEPYHYRLSETQPPDKLPMFPVKMTSQDLLKWAETNGYLPAIEKPTLELTGKPADLGQITAQNRTNSEFAQFSTPEPLQSSSSLGNSSVGFSLPNGSTAAKPAPITHPGPEGRVWECSDCHTCYFSQDTFDSHSCEPATGYSQVSHWSIGKEPSQ
jgi:hypothetical protein